MRRGPDPNGQRQAPTQIQKIDGKNYSGTLLTVLIDKSGKSIDIGCKITHVGTRFDTRTWKICVREHRGVLLYKFEIDFHNFFKTRNILLKNLTFFSLKKSRAN